MKQLDLWAPPAPVERTGPAGDDEAAYPYRFMSPELQRLTREDAQRRLKETPC